ncbi:50S ribosomal protein L21 [subsurface metagenome]
MYTLVEIKGKQYRAEKGALLKIDRVDKEKGESLEFKSVLFVSDEKKVKIGTPYVKGVKVKAIVEEHGKNKKITIYKYKKRKNYRRKQGHRQQYSLIRVQDIQGLGSRKAGQAPAG